MNEIEKAFILHQRPYRETSVLLELLTERHGRITAIAKGVRIKKSKTRSILQPFNPLLLTWYGKGELVTLGSIDTYGPFIYLQGDCLLSAFYLNELLIRLTHKFDPHPTIYTIYHQTLLELQNNSFLQKTLRLFEKQILEELGYELSFLNITQNHYYRYQPEKGFESCVENAGYDIFLGKNLLAIANNDLDCEIVLADAKRLMRLSLAPLLGEKKLQSRKLFLEVEKK